MVRRDELDRRRARLTPRQQAMLARRLQGEAPERPAALPLAPREEEGPAPLSFAQERFWFIEQMTPGTPGAILTRAYRMEGPLEAGLLAEALTATVARHALLRTVYRVEAGRVVQVPLPPVPVPLPLEDLRGARSPEEAVRARAQAESQVPFDLAGEPPVRFRLYRTGEQEHVLLAVLHHIAFDGWSVRVLMEELAAAYDGLAAGKTAYREPLPVQYADYAVWQRAQVEQNGQVHLDYWRRRLDGLAMPELPADAPRPDVPAGGAGRAVLDLDAARTEAFRILCRHEGVTPFMGLLAALQIVLARQTGHEDVAVGTPVAGRTHPSVERLVGCFINTLVLRTDLAGQPDYRTILRRVRAGTLAAYAHMDLPFERLLSALQPDRDLLRTPLFQVMLNMQAFDRPPLRTGGLVLSAYPLPETEARFDLTLYARDQGTTLSLEAVYRRDLYRPERMDDLLDQLDLVLKDMTADPGRSAQACSLVTRRARTVLPDPMAPLDATWQGSVPAGVARQARRHPDRVAVVDAGGAWTYGELEARSNQLARRLVDAGIGRGEVVVIYAHRSTPLVWALLGVMKAGGVFVILDPAYPPERLAAYLRVVRPRAWLQVAAAGDVPRELAAELERHPLRERLVLPGMSEAGAVLEGLATDPFGVRVGPDDPAYVAFTSGSTGTPLGVVGRHGSLTHFQPWLCATFGFTEADRFSLLSGLAHDPLHRDVFTPLLAGATLCIPDAAALAPGRLAAWMQSAAITVTHLTPAMGRVLVQGAPPGTLSHLRVAFFVGEALTAGDVARLRRVAPAVRVVNYYGTTETQRAVGYFDVGPGEMGPFATGVIPAGRGIPDTQLLVLNAGGGLAGIGEAGEICVRSPHLALGYLDDDERTRRRFIPNPFTGAAGDRLYRTRDQGRYRPDGHVEIIGRMDRQVNLRGFRIEPAEVEAVLTGHPDVAEAAVDVRGEGPQAGLVAYVVFRPGRTAPAAALRAYLARRLPSPMVPARVVGLAALPLTPNGKVDRKALPSPPPASTGTVYIPPRDEVERRLVAIWERILEQTPVGVQANFFDLGGHSLQAVALLSEVSAAFGKTLPLRSMFEAQTVEEQARLLREGAGRPEGRHLVTLRSGGELPPLFCVHNLGGTALLYGALARRVGGSRPVYGLQGQGVDGRPVTFADVEAMARAYVAEVRACHPSGPYHLLSFCLGSRVALAMAHRLRAEGAEVGVLAFVDGTSPEVARARRRGELLEAYEQPLSGEPVGQGASLRERVRASMAIRARRWRRRLHRGVAAGYRVLGQPIPEAFRLAYVMEAYRRLMRAYDPPRYPGRLTVFRSSRLRDLPPDLGWSSRADEVAAFDIDGPHRLLDEPYVADLAAILVRCLAEAEAERGG